ncbi:MAG TPA: hypothetical protein VLC55_04940 [Burkholderiales bacterium]|nr:hypothetical protein [Burkholderiales bacterium]
MDMTTVYAKTAKGQEEISSRTHKLGHKLRLVLILMDGKLSVAEHQAKAGALGDVVSLMDELERGGFIERLGHGGAAAAPAAAAPGTAAALGPAAPAGPGLPLPELRQKLNKLIHDYLGPDGDAFTEKIEKCRTREEVRAYYTSVQVAFREILGKRRAEELNAKCNQWLG